MNVNKWGPGGWTFLHTITFNYPLVPNENDKTKYKSFFNTIGDMLPCKYCRESYKIYIKYIPIDLFLDSREGLCFWLYKIHELINYKIYKKNVPFEEIIRKYENIRAKCGKMTVNNNLDKQYKTCQKPSEINIDYLNKFILKANTYKEIINKMIKNLYNSNENPNKNNKNIFYIKYTS